VARPEHDAKGVAGRPIHKRFTPWDSAKSPWGGLVGSELALPESALVAFREEGLDVPVATKGSRRPADHEAIWCHALATQHFR